MLKNIFPITLFAAGSESACEQNENPATETPKEEMIYCQSCGMPLQQAADFGTEANGIPNNEYCTYCYQNGAFTSDCSMEEMIQECAKFHDQFQHEDGRTFSREDAIALMRQYFPELKRWKKESMPSSQG